MCSPCTNTDRTFCWNPRPDCDDETDDEDDCMLPSPPVFSGFPSAGTNVAVFPDPLIFYIIYIVFRI